MRRVIVVAELIKCKKQDSHESDRVRSVKQGMVLFTLKSSVRGHLWADIVFGGSDSLESNGTLLGLLGFSFLCLFHLRIILLDLMAL